MQLLSDDNTTISQLLSDVDITTSISTTNDIENMIADRECDSNYDYNNTAHIITILDKLALPATIDKIIKSPLFAPPDVPICIINHNLRGTAMMRAYNANYNTVYTNSLHVASINTMQHVYIRINKYHKRSKYSINYINWYNYEWQSLNNVSLHVLPDDMHNLNGKIAESIYRVSNFTFWNDWQDPMKRINDTHLLQCINIMILDANNNPYITTCGPFAHSLRILFADGLCGITDAGLEKCMHIEELHANDNKRITTCDPFAHSLRILHADLRCGITDIGLLHCTNLVILRAHANINITSCTPFASSLRELLAETLPNTEYKKCTYLETLYVIDRVTISNTQFPTYLANLYASDSSITDTMLKNNNCIKSLDVSKCNSITTCEPFAASLCVLHARKSGITDAGLKKCINIKELHTGHNGITTCDQFANSLRLLRADATLSDCGLTRCVYIEILYAGNNEKITTCDPFARSLRILGASGTCGISDNGLRKCKYITKIDVNNNAKITSCDPFAKSLIEIYASDKHYITDDSLALCINFKKRFAIIGHIFASTYFDEKYDTW